MAEKLIPLNLNEDFKRMALDLFSHLRIVDGYLEFYDGYFWKKVGFLQGPMGFKGIQGEKGDSIKGDTGKPGQDAPTIKQIVDTITPLLPEAIEGPQGKQGKTGKAGKSSPPLEKIVQELAEYIPDPIPGKNGLNGKDGKPGKKGKDAPTLLEILAKIPSPEKGEIGLSPEHELNKQKNGIRFKNPDKTWGEWVSLATTIIKGGGASGASNFVRWVTLTASRTINKMDREGYLINAADNAITLTLPPAWDTSGRVFFFKRTDSSDEIVTIQPNGTDTIDGQDCLLIGTQYQNRRLSSDGANWFLI